MRKADFCLGENKGADQLRGNCETDQRLCFRFTDTTMHALRITKFSRFYFFSVTVQVGLCLTWSETPKTGFFFVATHLIIRLLRWGVGNINPFGNTL